MENKKFILGFDHYTIESSDLKKSDHFYHEVLGLARLERPNFSFPGAWYDLKGASLHLIENKNQESKVAISNTRSLHFAFTVTNIYALRDYLLTQNIEIIKDIKMRPDGHLQLFVRDPDGYAIEFASLPEVGL
jgi:catechol 2,3-dioxygenase-like lactoylglutathione lyase family enzyme